MPEYVIRTSRSHDWPAFHRDRNPEVLLPAGFGCEAIDGSGDFRMRCGDVAIWFSAEEVGWHVVIEGDTPAADQLVAQVTRQVADAAGEPCEWLPLG